MPGFVDTPVVFIEPSMAWAAEGESIPDFIGPDKSACLRSWTLVMLDDVGGLRMGTSTQEATMPVPRDDIVAELRLHGRMPTRGD